MADGFEHMVDSALAFFTELSLNNSKDWFAPRKDHYSETIKKPAEFLGDVISEDLARITGRAHRPKLFRIYRDVRFSKDKTPLNAHLHLMWSDPGGDDLTPSWFFGLAPDYFIMGMGVMGLKGDGLAKFRAHIDHRGDVLQGALNDGEQRGLGISDWGPELLKRVPKPYAVDHPQAELLKRKALAVTGPIAPDWRDMGLVKAMNARINDLKPIADALHP